MANYGDSAKLNESARIVAEWRLMACGVIH